MGHRHFFCILLGLSFFVSLPIFSNGENTHQKSETLSVPHRIVFNGNHLEYLERSQLLKARGQVRLVYHNITLTAAEMAFDLQSGEVSANGDILLQEHSSTIYGNYLVYNIKKKTGIVEKIKITSTPWHAQGKQVEKKSENSFQIDEGFFTTCTLDNPHYRLVSKKISILLKNKIEAWDILVKVGDVPILWLPYISWSLKDDRPPLTIRFGRNDLAGIFIRTKYSYHLSEEISGSVSLDYMTKKVVGLGLGLQYDKSDLMNTDLEGYQISEQDTGFYRWMLQGNHTQTLSPEDRLIFSFQNYSDGDFDRDYQSRFINHQQKSFIAFSKNTSAYSASLSAQQIKSWNPQQSNYIPALDTAPAFNFQLTPIKIGLSSWYFSLQSTAKRERMAQIDAEYNFEESVYARLERGSLIVPTIQWNSSFSLSESYRRSLRGSILADNEIRIRHSPFIKSQLGHHLGYDLPFSSEDPHRGLTQHLLDGWLDWSLTEIISAKLRTGYDFKSLALDPLQRMQLVILDFFTDAADSGLSLYASAGFNPYWMEVQNIRQGINIKSKEAWQCYGELQFENRGIPGINYFNTPDPVAAYSPQPNLLNFSSRFSLTLPILGVCSASQYYDVVTKNLLAQEYSLICPLIDCISADFSWRQSSQRTDILFSIFLSAFSQHRFAFPTSPLGGLSL